MEKKESYYLIICDLLLVPKNPIVTTLTLRMDESLNMSSKQRLLGIVSQAEGSVVTGILTELINKADASVLTLFMTLTAVKQAMSPPSSSSCMSVVSVDANCNNNIPQANRSKKKRRIMNPSASLFQASPLLRFVNMYDLVSDLIFPFFDLPTHMIAGRVCSALLKVAGLYIPFLHQKTSVGALSRPVELPDSITNDQFRRFCVIASPVAIDLFFCLKITGDCFY